MPVRPNAGKLSAAVVTLLVSGVTALGVGSVGGLAGTAQAATPPAAKPTVAAPKAKTLAPITHPQNDTAGSQIRLHEHEVTTTVTPRLNTGLRAFATTAPPYGMDVSNYQGNINWPAQKAAGAAFVYIKATENTTFQNPYFAQQYNGAYSAGLIRGAYHFALPDRSSGATQAQYFVAHGGGWSADGHTLPPMLDIEYNPYGASECYGLTQAQMVAWIRDFSNTVHALTTRYPTIYTSADWWNTCTGYNATFGSTNPLFIARWASTPGVMPAGWSFQTLWQYNDAGIYPGDADVFNGSMAQLLTFAGQPSTTPVKTPAPTVDPVTSYYNKLGGQSHFGAPTSALITVAGGSERDYQGGNIYYSAATGAHVVHGAILAEYKATGGPAGLLGFPTTDETGAPDKVGRYNQFAGTGGASIYWTPKTGAHEVQGLIRQHWSELSWERGILGYPITDERATRTPGGRYNNFQGGSMTWFPAAGTHEVNGAIKIRWQALGADAGRLGFPTADEYSVPGGRRSSFQHGTITWMAATNALTVAYTS
jgi:GH25 family lysozyme M1 (1,4-beta-N-acetylmuramidase)